MILLVKHTRRGMPMKEPPAPTLPGTMNTGGSFIMCNWLKNRDEILISSIYVFVSVMRSTWSEQRKRQVFPGVWRWQWQRWMKEVKTLRERILDNVDVSFLGRSWVVAGVVSDLRFAKDGWRKLGISCDLILMSWSNLKRLLPVAGNVIHLISLVYLWFLFYDQLHYVV